MLVATRCLHHTNEKNEYYISTVVEHEQKKLVSSWLFSTPYAGPIAGLNRKLKSLWDFKMSDFWG